jgi:hypothetical protein
MTTDSTKIKLRIKAIQRDVISIAISRNASVLDLKNMIGTAFQVESIRQRLIFQGKVLKDDKSLLEYGII